MQLPSFFTDFYEKEFFVKEHDYYYTPSKGYVVQCLGRVGLNTANHTFARELARFFFHKSLNNPDYVKDEWLIEQEDSDLSEEIMNKHTFYNSLFEDNGFIPGYTPFEKALNYMMAMKEGEMGDGEVNFKDKKFATLKVDFPDKEKWEAKEIKELLQSRNLDNFKERLPLLKKICLVEEFGKTFEIKKTITERRVANSEISKLKRLVEFEQLPASPLYQRLMPNFLPKLITKDIIVSSPIVKEESKQKIIMLVDYSGSMCEDFKQGWVLSILADRLQYCMKEECVIYFSFFLTHEDLVKQRFTFTKVENREQALKLFQGLSIRPSGGDTEIGDVVEAIRHEIMENRTLFNLSDDLSKEKPEILIINDGQLA